MAETHTTEQGDCTHEALIDTELRKKFAIVARDTGLTFPESGLADLQCALAGFERNRELWRTNQRWSPLHPTLVRHILFTLWVPGGRANRTRMAVDKVCHLWLEDTGYDPVRSWHPADIYQAIKGLVRFPKQKAYRTVEALAVFNSLRLNSSCFRNSTYDIHQTIHKGVMGYGPKAAAHIMRNTGLSQEWNSIPIIDVHILRFLGGDASASRYTHTSNMFIDRAIMYGIPPLLLDAALWCASARNWNMKNSDFDNFERKPYD